MAQEIGNLTWHIRGVTTLRYAQWCRWGLSQIRAQTQVNQFSQSGLCVLRCALKRSNLLHAHWQQKCSSVLPPPNEPILGNDNTCPICSPNTVLDARAAFAWRVANAKLFVSSGEWDVKQYETQVSKRNHNSFGTPNLCGVNNMCCSFVPNGKIAWCECPVNVRRSAHNGSAKFSKMNVQSL